MASIDYSRTEGLIDSLLLSNSHIAIVGAGGAANLICNLARTGCSLSVVEFDQVSATNPICQSYSAAEIGTDKADALERRIEAINPDCSFEAFKCRYEELSDDQFRRIWSADLVLAMTDSFKAQAQINKDSIRHGVDTIFAIAYIGASAIEVTGTFPKMLPKGTGCHRCHVSSRYQAHSEGYENPEVIGSHIFAAEALNSILGLLTISTLHWQQNSDLEISSLAGHFVTRPCLIQRIGGPDYWAAENEPFADADAESALFNTKTYALDTQCGWTCPDCSTPGIINQAIGA